MNQANPGLDYVAVASLAIAIASFVASCISAVIAGQSRNDAERIAERAHDEWAQQKWFDLYFATNSAYDAMDKLQADCVVQGDRIISVRGGESYPDSCQQSDISFSGDSSNGDGVPTIRNYRQALFRYLWICR
jgi:hypothetical protein